MEYQKRSQEALTTPAGSSDVTPGWLIVCTKLLPVHYAIAILEAFFGTLPLFNSDLRSGAALIAKLIKRSRIVP